MMIDLRSDTVTKPSPAMRAAMAAAEVGDEGYREDPTVNRLQAKAAALLGKEDSLFVPSGTMANLVALMTHTRPSDSVILGQKAHTWLYESGGPGAIAGVLTILVGTDGTFTWADVEANARGGEVHMAPTTLIMMENTHNGGGGIIFPQEHVIEIGAKAKFWAFKTHIDGARILNSAVAQGKSAAELCAPADSVSLCFSKGLGCPIGSVVAGTREFIERARRYRELLGGGMRQAGVLAAAGLYALEHNVARLAEDHANARLLAERLSDLPGIEIDLARVQTNMVFITVTRPGLTALDLAVQLAKLGVKVNPLDRRQLRAVTHLDVSRQDMLAAAEVFARALRA
jgi:threonine aldolase